MEVSDPFSELDFHFPPINCHFSRFGSRSSNHFLLCVRLFLWSLFQCENKLDFVNGKRNSCTYTEKTIHLVSNNKPFFHFSTSRNLCVCVCVFRFTVTLFQPYFFSNWIVIFFCKRAQLYWVEMSVSLSSGPIHFNWTAKVNICSALWCCYCVSYPTTCFHFNDMFTFVSNTQLCSFRGVWLLFEPISLRFQWMTSTEHNYTQSQIEPLIRAAGWIRECELAKCANTRPNTIFGVEESLIGYIIWL